MTIYKILLFSLTVAAVSCSSHYQLNKIYHKGKVTSENTTTEISFTTIKGLIVIPASIDGRSKNFLFDTGADLTVIQQDSITGDLIEVVGGSKKSEDMGSGFINSFKIGDIEFSNTYSVNSKLDGLKEKIPNFGGVIGQPIITRANWLIDYPKKKLTISTQDLSDGTFQKLKLTKNEVAPYVYLSINGKKYKTIIDLGSSACLSIPEELKLANDLLKQYNFSKNSREVWTVGGSRKIHENIGIIPELLIGDIVFSNIETNIHHSSQMRIGIRFFEDYTIYIDNNSGDYKIKKNIK